MDMPKKGYDYETAQVMRVKGLSYSNIGKTLGIPLEALVKYGQRHNWDKARTKAVQSMSDVVQKDISSFAQRHILKITEFADKALDNLIGRGFEMPLDDLQTLVGVANSLDCVMRRAYRMDEQQAKPSTLLSFNFNGNSSPVVTGNEHVIELADLESVKQVADASDTSKLV